MFDRDTDGVSNEVASRARNEWVEPASAIVGIATGTDPYACECGYSGCEVSIDLTREEYEAVRQDGNRFAIAINHEDPEIELVVAEHVRYAVVEKSFGEARRIANDTDPRRLPLPSTEPPALDDAKTPGTDHR